MYFARFNRYVLGFVMGCLTTSTVFLARMSHRENDEYVHNYDLADVSPELLVDKTILSAPSTNPPSKTTSNDNAVVPEQATTIWPAIKEIDCQHHHAEGDPNEGLEEDPKRFINQTAANFWISLHKQGFDPLRWNSIMKQGIYYEKGVTKIFQEILQHADPKGYVVDVGMNIGWYSIYSRAMGHKVLGFDPNPIMHSRVCSSLKLNQWWDGISDNTSSSSSGITTFAYGLGDRVENLNLGIGHNPGASSFLKKQGRSINVPVTTLDLVATQMGWLQQESQDVAPIIYLLKIDTEGYEPFIIRGGSKLLFSGLVQNIVAENKPNKEGSPKEVLEWFTMLWRAGFEVKELHLPGWKGEKKFKEWTKNLNDSLRNGEFEGSESHQHFAKEMIDMWWTKRTS